MKKKTETVEEVIFLVHDCITDRITVKDWIEIQLAFHKRNETAVEWLSSLEISYDCSKRLCELKEIEWVGLQLLVASLHTKCIIYDSYTRYSMEEILFINRLLRKITRKYPIEMNVKDKRILHREISKSTYIKICISCRDFNAEKYLSIADIHQEGENLISYFDERERAIRFSTKILKQEKVYYLEMVECDEKTDI